MQDITAYAIISVAHYIVVGTGLASVAFLIYNRAEHWLPVLIATVLIALLCQRSYSHQTYSKCPKCGYEFIASEDGSRCE